MKDKLFDVIILASGISVRFGKDKLFEIINGKELILKTAEVFSNSPYVQRLIIVCNVKSINLIKNLLDNKLHTVKPVIYTLGGDTRALSSKAGIKESLMFDSKNVMITDADRCFVSEKLIERLVTSFTDNAIPVIRHSETLKFIRSGKFDGKIKDEDLYEIQTPQLFDKEKIGLAFNNCFRDDALDDSEIFFNYYSDSIVNIVKGDIGNIKITYPSDIQF